MSDDPPEPPLVINDPLLVSAALLGKFRKTVGPGDLMHSGHGLLLNDIRPELAIHRTPTPAGSRRLAPGWHTGAWPTASQRAWLASGAVLPHSIGGRSVSPRTVERCRAQGWVEPASFVRTPRGRHVARFVPVKGAVAEGEVLYHIGGHCWVTVQAAVPEARARRIPIRTVDGIEELTDRNGLLRQSPEAGAVDGPPVPTPSDHVATS